MLNKANDSFAGDANDDFIVEITPRTRGRRDKQARHRLKTLRSEFRLRHALSGCYLFSHKVKLPEWGFEQQEGSLHPLAVQGSANNQVTCNKNPTYDNSLWYIETNNHAQRKLRLPGTRNELICSRFRRTKSQLRKTKLLCQVLGIAGCHVEDQRRIDR
jgi:dolichyl-phosphate-mannose--protein O-mannosyl transferase